MKLEEKTEMIPKTPLYERTLAAMEAAGADTSLLDPRWFEEQPWLVICGGGHVLKSIVEMAAHMDFRIKVIDDREEFVDPANYPAAKEVICDSFENLEKYLEPDACYIVVTRGHRDDARCVRTILKHSYRYLGMIGSQLKVTKTFENFRREGISQEQIDTVFAPIGVDINAVTPPEIAISILAQVIQVKNSRQSSSASKELLYTDKHGILCIIIEKEGSSPRGVGSMMLITESEFIDSVGGGNIEYAVIEDAKTCTGVMIRDYNLNNKDSIRLGMICGGSNKVLFIPI